MEAEFVEHPGRGIYAPGEAVHVAWQVQGIVPGDRLAWTAVDHRGGERLHGTMVIAERCFRNHRPGRYGSGRIRPPDGAIARARPLPRAGTRPAGYLAYGVLLKIAAVLPAAPDASRFGMQGTDFAMPSAAATS